MRLTATIYIAHLDIEGIAMDREVMHDFEICYQPKSVNSFTMGFWFSPEMDFFDVSDITKSGVYRWKSNPETIQR